MYLWWKRVDSNHRPVLRMDADFMLQQSNIFFWFCLYGVLPLDELPIVKLVSSRGIEPLFTAYHASFIAVENQFVVWYALVGVPFIHDGLTHYVIWRKVLKIVCKN